MNARFINPFVKAAFHVLEHELEVTPCKGELSLESTYYTSKAVTVMVGVTGELRGSVLYGMSEETAKRIASKMMDGRTPVFDQLAESAIKELGNVITGMASSELEKLGFHCDISPPSLIVGRKTIISTASIRRLVIPVEVPLGEVQISVALERAGC